MTLTPSARSSRHRTLLADPRGRRGAGPRKGFAMFMALGALVIVAVLIAGSSFLTTQEARLGQNQLVQSRAMAAAEYGLNRIQADWDRTPNLQMANGAFFDTSYTLTNQGTTRVRYVRLNDETFWITSEGRATVGNSTSAARTAVKRVGAILRLRVPTIKANGAVTSAGVITTQGSAQIRGANTANPGWTGCPSAPDKAAIVVSSSTSYSIQKAGNVTGTPQVTIDPLAADSNTYVRFGDETWNALVASANITTSAMADGAPTTNADGSCNKNSATNYGEPLRSSGYVAACINYFPIIYVNTTTSSHGGRGQGILIINGDFNFNAGFEWHGLIIVKDDITKANGHAAVYGGIMARNANPADATEDFTGTVDIFYSSCALDRAMRGSAQVVQAKQRAWTEMY